MGKKNLRIIEHYRQLSQKKREILINGIVVLTILVAVGILMVVFAAGWCEPCETIKAIGG